MTSPFLRLRAIYQKMSDHVELTTHYHQERNHQGLSMIVPNSNLQTAGSICRRERLGGMLNYYYRSAA